MAVWARVTGWVGTRWRAVPRPLWAAIVGGVCLLPGVFAMAETYPFGTCYYNAAIGGLRGARALGVPQATDYWGNSYWQGMAWLNANAPEGAAVYVPIAEHLVVVAAPVRLRPDIKVQPKSLAECSGEVFVMYITRPAWYDALVFHLEERQPAHTIEVQGAPILAIHRLRTDAEKAAMFERLAAEQGALVRRGDTFVHAGMIVEGGSSGPQAAGEDGAAQVSPAHRRTMRVSCAPFASRSASSASWSSSTDSSTRPTL